MLLSRIVFNKYHAEKELALSLIHRHFDLQPAERLVEYGRVTAPWVLNEYSSHKVRPKSWAFIGDELYPYEFEYNPLIPSKAFEFDEGFLSDFQQTLRDHNLMNTFGIALAPADDPDFPCLIEFTAGRTNVLSPFDHDEDQIGVEAVWTFSCVWNPMQDGSGKPTTRMCRVKCPYC